jgi:hypothetical protein
VNFRRTSEISSSEICGRWTISRSIKLLSSPREWGL